MRAERRLRVVTQVLSGPWAQLAKQHLADTNSYSTPFSQLYRADAVTFSSRHALGPKCKQASSYIPAVTH